MIVRGKPKKKPTRGKVIKVPGVPQTIDGRFINPWDDSAIPWELEDNNKEEEHV